MNLVPRISLRRGVQPLAGNFGCRRPLRGNLYPRGSGKHVSIHLFHKRKAMCHDDPRQSQNARRAFGFDPAPCRPGPAGRSVSTHSFSGNSIEPCHRDSRLTPTKSSEGKNGVRRGVAVEFLMGDRWHQGETQGRDVDARETARTNLQRSSPSEIEDCELDFS